jgi:hypothetical protein
MQAQEEARGQLGWWAYRSIRTKGQAEIAVPVAALRTALASPLKFSHVNDRPERPSKHSPVK